MSDMVKVSICDGKYTIIQDASGRTSVLRHGEEWRDSTGDNVILGAAYEIQKLQDRIKRLEEAHSWRLIETAPSDYTWILGYDEKHGETGMIIFERGDESEPHWTDGMREWEPTHWMPLPEEPKAKEAKL